MGALLVGFSSTSLSSRVPQMERAGELCIGDAYGYPEMRVTTPGAAALSRRYCRERGRNWGGGEIPVPCSPVDMKHLQY